MANEYPYIDWDELNKKKGVVIFLLLTTGAVTSGKLLSATPSVVEVESPFGNIITVSTTQIIKVNLAE